MRPPRGRGEPPALGRDQIVAAAIELLDAAGLDGLTMRKLGTKLGAGATSAYWYVANKGELLDLVLDELMAEVEVPDAAAGWRDAAATFARTTRAMVLRHPWITGLFGDRMNNGPNGLAAADRLIAVMQAAGFSPQHQGYASSLLVNYALGAALAEAAWCQTVARSGMSEQELTDSMLAAYRDSISADYPHTARWMTEIGPFDARQMQEEGFDFGLDRLLDGLESWLHRAAAS